MDGCLFGRQTETRVSAIITYFETAVARNERGQKSGGRFIGIRGVPLSRYL